MTNSIAVAPTLPEELQHADQQVDRDRDQRQRLQPERDAPLGPRHRAARTGYVGRSRGGVHAALFLAGKRPPRTGVVGGRDALLPPRARGAPLPRGRCDVRGGAAASSRRPARCAIGMVTDVGGLGDRSFNDSAYAGLVRAKKRSARRHDRAPVALGGGLSDQHDRPRQQRVRRDLRDRVLDGARRHRGRGTLPEAAFLDHRRRRRPAERDLGDVQGGGRLVSRRRARRDDDQDEDDRVPGRNRHPAAAQVRGRVSPPARARSTPRSRCW